MLNMLCTKEMIVKDCCLLIVIPFSLATAFAQSYEVTPLFGVRVGGTMELQQPGVPNYDAHIADSFNFGVAGGYRFNGEGGEGYDLVEFRWMRQDSHLSLNTIPLVPTPYASSSYRPSVNLDGFLGDFSHEFAIQDNAAIQPFIRASAGVAVLSVPQSNAARFTFGIGTGLKVFPSTHYGFRVEVEYLPVVMHTELQKLVCAGGCVVILNGGIMNQFQVSIGPSFRF